MICQNIARRVVTGSIVVLFGLSSVVRARPMMDDSVLLQPRAQEMKKLPPVNWIRSRNIDVKDITLDLRFDWDKEQAIGSEVITFATFTDTDKFTLDAGQMTIDSINLVGGGALKFSYDGKAGNDNLEISLGRVFAAGQDVKVKIEYKTNHVNAGDQGLAGFGNGLRFIKPTPDNPTKPRQIWSQGESEFNRFWFPSYDSPNDFHTSEIRATVEKPFTVVSNGKLISTKDNKDNTRTFDWKMDQPFSNYLASIVVSETTPVVQDADGTPVYNYGYTNETKEVAATVKNLPATIKFFSEITGVKYPYPKYSQAFVEDFGGGMENISATTQIEQMIHDERELLDTDSESLQSHELGHQWFGDYVTCRDWGQIWLNESFATYMQAMWDEKFKGHDDFLYLDVRSNQNQTIGTWNQGNRRPIVTDYYADKDALFDNYAYPGGGSVLHMLRKHLGDKLFFASLKNYLTTNAHQPVSTEDLRIAVEESTGQSMDWFFDQWVYKMGHPIFEVTQNYDEAKKQLALTVKQTQKVDVTNPYPQTDLFQTYVDIEIDNLVTRVWIEPKTENVFTFDSPTRPKLVNFDYESTLLKELKFEKSTDDLLYQFSNDKDVLGRQWALTELVKKASNPADKARVLSALLTSSEKDPFWRIRRAAFQAFSGIVSPPAARGQQKAAAQLDDAATQAALRLAKDPQSLIRGDAIRLLSDLRDAKYADLFLAALNDQSYSVIDQAATALARTKDARAYDALVKLAATHSWKGRIEGSGLRALAELGDKRALDTALKMASDTSLSTNLRLSAVALVAATGKGDPRAYQLVFDKFKTALDAGSINGVLTTLNAMVKIADPRGQEAFDLAKAKFKDQPNRMGPITNLETQFKAAIGQ